VGLFERHIRESFLNVAMVATNFCILGTVLWLTDRLPAGKLTASQMRWFHALLIGMGQALSALFRGLSRSGMTLSVALLLQLERTWAVRFSFAMSLVANLGLAGLGLVHAWRDAQTAHWLTPSFLSWTLLATLTSAVVGYATLQPLLRLVQRSRMRWFGYYLWLAGLVAWGIYAWRSA
jgi:undecaprenyl-diphosphatase